MYLHRSSRRPSFSRFSSCTLIAAAVALAGCATPQASAPGVVVKGNGDWSLTLGAPRFAFAGTLGVAATGLGSDSGHDAIGDYHEVTFAYRQGGARHGAIRVYDSAPIALFLDRYDDAAANDTRFPTLQKLPATPYHLSYLDQQFSPYSFSSFGADSPWIFFDHDHNTFILSAASHFMNAALAQDDASGAISAGISSDVVALPAGFEIATILVVEPGINEAFDTWGGALLALGGKQRPANDSTTDLKTLGYWTDNGAAYYYDYDMQRGYTGTLLAVRDEFAQKGMPLGYMQLDSWWYPKGSPDGWNDRNSGEYTLTADPTLFPDGLSAFQQELGMPLVTHARWIDPDSPYRQQYAMSGNVSIDPRFWSDMGAYLAHNGVATYEQDWLDMSALPLTTNLTDQDAFMDNMSKGMAAAGLEMQYCMPMPRHFLQSTRYANLVTTRVNFDHFMPARYPNFFYASRLARALGEWPWTDVFMSTEENNLLLSTLSAGMVGVGDAIGAESIANLQRVARPDGVLVKPDEPIVLLDRAIANEASGVAQPLFGATFSDFGGGQRMSYLFAFAKEGAQTSQDFSVTPSELGYSGAVYVYAPLDGSGQLVSDAQGSFGGLAGRSYAYWIVAPVGPSGIAFLGDAGKYVAAGKQRIRRWSDDGTLAVDVLFAPGESTVTLQGYAPSAPHAAASAGSVGPVQWDAGTQRFTVVVTAAAAAASITLTR